MDETMILDTLATLQRDISEIKILLLSSGKSKNIPKPHGFNPLGAKKCFSQKLRGPFKDPEIRKLILSLRKEGKSFVDLAQHIKGLWPDNPERWPSKSAIHYFCRAARNGRLKEYGIKGLF